MPLTAARAADLLSKLGGGWPPLAHPPLDELLAVWKEEVASIHIQNGDRDAICFQSGLPKSRLRGSHELECLALGGDSPDLRMQVREFVRLQSGPGRLLFLFCLSEAAETAARAEVRSDRCVIWLRRHIQEAWSSGHLLGTCYEMVRARVPARMLMPYDITVSASGPMFYGRDTELSKLLQEDSQSFAVTGPGRIGKTSLVRRLKEELAAKGDPDWITVFYVDFYECADKSPTALSRKIAMTMEPGRRADRMTADDLAGFIEYQQHRLHSRPTLILDEVDEVCDSKLFKEQVAVPAKDDFARFILVGKAGLLRFTKDASGALANRLRMIKLGELDAASARKLLSEPIRDLGMEFEDFEQVFGMVDRYTGRSPHMIQYFGQRLVELAAEQGVRRILAKHIDLLRWDHQTACFFLSPLDDLKRVPVAHVVALALLKEGPASITPVTIQDVARMHGVSIAHSEAVEIGDILVINNVLLWADGAGYRIANQALPEYAGKMGYLTRGLEEAKQRLGKSPVRN